MGHLSVFCEPGPGVCVDVELATRLTQRLSVYGILCSINQRQSQDGPGVQRASKMRECTFAYGHLADERSRDRLQTDLSETGDMLLRMDQGSISLHSLQLGGSFPVVAALKVVPAAAFSEVRFLKLDGIAYLLIPTAPGALGRITPGEFQTDNAFPAKMEGTIASPGQQFASRPANGITLTGDVGCTIGHVSVRLIPSSLEVCQHGL